VSSDEAAYDVEDQEHVSFILMRATETFDGQERMMSRAAYDLQVRATAHSTSCGHPGFVPDDYLEHLDGLRIETTITAAELCTAGMWERVDGGNRVLDWQAVEIQYASTEYARSEGRTPRAWPGNVNARPWSRLRPDFYHPTRIRSGGRAVACRFADRNRQIYALKPIPSCYCSLRIKGVCSAHQADRLRLCSRENARNV
jgi:hypothetical protein